MKLIAASLPPLVAAILLLSRRSPAFSSICSLLSGVVLLLVFPVSFHTLLNAEAMSLTIGIEVVLIIFGGIWLYQILNRANAYQPIGIWMSRLSTDSARLILLIVLGVTPFAESVTGFGVGVVVALPLLSQIGFSPYQSAVLSLLGLIAVPWGALAPGSLIASRLTDIPFQTVGMNSAWISLPVFLFAGTAALTVGLGWRKAMQKSADLCFVSLALWGGILAANHTVGTPLAGVIGSLVSIIASLLLIRFGERRFEPLTPELIPSLSPYAILVFLLLLSRISSAVLPAGMLQNIAASPIGWIFLTCLIAPFLVGHGLETTRSAFAGAVLYSRSVTVTTIAFMALGGLMLSSDMVGTLAAGAAHLGKGYVALYPWIGGLGGFLTGSNTGANAMFAVTQAQAAAHMGYPKEWMVPVQNVTASLLTMASAPRIALVTSLIDQSVLATRILRTVIMVDALLLTFFSFCLLSLRG